MKLSLVCPCYNEQDNVEKFYDECVRVLTGKVESFEFVFINDGSRDGTWKKLLGIYEGSHGNVKLVNFSRNFGKEAAMYAGLSKAEGEYTVVIDTDLQQRPETVLLMVEHLDANPDCDCVAAYQEKRREGGLMSFFKSAFYKVINRVCETEFRDGASDFRTFRVSVREAVLSLRESHRFAKGIFSFVGFETYYMPYTASERNAGVSAWNFKKLFKYALGGIMSFTTFPLKAASFCGVAFLILSPVWVVVKAVLALLGAARFTTLDVLVWAVFFVGGTVLACMGVMCEYLARMYVQSKDRPICIIKEYREPNGK